MSSSTLFLPALSAFVITSRNCWSPEPIVIFPSSLMISIPSALREVAFMSSPLGLSVLRVGDAFALRQILGHDQGGAASRLKRVLHPIHERFHVENPAPARLHEVLRVE